RNASDHRHTLQRVVIHGTDSAGGAHREERNHFARFHTPSDADGSPSTGARDRRSRAGTAATDPDDYSVHSVRIAAAGAWTWRGKRAPETAGAGGDRGTHAVHADNALHGADAFGSHQRPQLQAVPLIVLVHDDVDNRASARNARG